MPRYRFVGDTPRSMPALGLEVEPGQEIDVPEEIRHGEFELIPEKKAGKAAPKEE
jgi:hypothetical protein